MRLLLSLCTLLLLSACTLHQVCEPTGPTAAVPEEYYNVKAGEAPIGRWWENFDDEELNLTVNQALSCNFDLRSAWHRLTQAKAVACIENAGKFPQLNVNASTLHSKSKGSPGISASGGSSFFGVGTYNSISVAPTLSYEVDLWSKIESKACAAAWNMRATREDYEATAMMLSGSVVDLWLTIQEQRELYRLLQEQRDTNETLVELLELRFSVGEASALDVYQQRQTLAATNSEIPPVVSRLKTSQQQLEVLLGTPPCGNAAMLSEVPLPNLPPFPDIGNPCQLLECRPDLRAAKNRLMAADYEVAAAIADRLPQLNLSLSYEWSSTTWSQLFNREVGSIIGSLVAPIFDGGRRKCEVERRRAIVYEQLEGYSQTYLNAMLEVEDAIVQEKYQVNLLEKLHIQVSTAQDNLREAKSRYATGLSDYLPVIAALSSLQTLERRLISEKKNLLGYRSRLYRALGGCWTKELCLQCCEEL